MKKGKVLLTIIMMLVFGMAKGQTVAFIGDTTEFAYVIDDHTREIDSVVEIRVEKKLYADWKIYFDHSKRQLAFESYLENDSTCIQKDYWRNGRLKRKGKFIKGKDIDDFFSWRCDEGYCSNGQLLFKCCFYEDTLSTGYYCNGQKHFQYKRIDGIYADGIDLMWYENGQKMSEVNFVNHVMEGEKKYWDEKGKLQKIEIYSEGKLIKTK